MDINDTARIPSDNMLRVVPLSLLPSAAFTNHAVQHHIVSDRYNAQPGEFCWPPEEFLRAQLEIFGQVFARASLHLDAITLDLSISGQMLPVVVERDFIYPRDQWVQRISLRLFGALVVVPAPGLN